jgi:hypothetical protein
MQRRSGQEQRCRSGNHPPAARRGADTDHPARVPGPRNRDARPGTRTIWSTSNAKLNMGALEDGKPVKLTVEMPSPVHRTLVAYAKVHAQETGKPVSDPVKLIPAMVERFMATDRGFAKLHRTVRSRS